MTALLSMWTPGPIELMIVMFVFFFVVILLVFNLMVIRWIFRINEQIELMSQIRDEVKKLNKKG